MIPKDRAWSSMVVKVLLGTREVLESSEAVVDWRG